MLSAGKEIMSLSYAKRVLETIWPKSVNAIIRILETVKQPFNNKSSESVNNGVLCDSEENSYKSNEVPTVFNEHFVNIARAI